ncbi:ankyrin repeat domain-containing protein 26 [Pholidichthys leucotaenia]
MKKLFGLAKKKKHPSDTPDSASVLSVGYDLKDKDLGKLHKAVQDRDLAKLKKLAKKNDINQLDKENRTALHISCAIGCVEVVQFLVESKAKLNLCDNQRRSALMKAVQGQHEPCVNVLLENHADPNLVDINGNTAVHLAANIPSISTAVLLLQHGAEINAQNNEGFTPLSVAVWENHIEMAEFLLKENADVNSVDHDHRSPLTIAASNGEISMVQLLLRYDADVTLKDTKGLSADDHAAMKGHHPCSLLIIEHETQRKGGPSRSRQGPSSKKKMLLGGPSYDAEAGFSLGGPATDKDDVEDNSQSESLSRVSKRAADEWPSSEDDESELVKKKPLQVNLSKMIASKKEEALALTDSSLGGSESEPESESRVQGISPLPKVLSSSKPLQHPVDPSPISFPLKASLMASIPLQNYRKKADSTEEDEGDDDDEEEGDVSENENDRPKDSGESVEAASLAPTTQVSKDKKRDFLSELGLEKGEEDSQGSESQSEKSISPHEEKQSLHNQSQERRNAKENEENLFYIPSFLRGKEGSRIAMLEPWRSVGRPRGSQGDVGSSNDVKNEGQCAGNDDAIQKETDKPRWEPLSVLNKLQSDMKPNTDVLEELGLDDVDDLDDVSDWDSVSTTSKGTPPHQKMASSELEEFPGCSGSFVPEQKKNLSSPPPVAHPRSISPDKLLPSTSSPLAPHPQPRTRKMAPQKLESEEESDLEPDILASSNQTAQIDNHTQNSPGLPKTADPGSPELSSTAEENEGCIDYEELQQKAGKEMTKNEMEVQRSHFMVRGARRSRAPRTNTCVNGDPLCVFDDSTLSDVSDDERSLPASGQQKDKDHEAEDFDELTQSSDTATDDIDSPTSGYHHASLLIQKLDSATLDSTSIVMLQNIFHEYERSIQKLRSRHGYLAEKVSQLEMERAELKSSLEEVKDFKSALERNQLELQTEVTNLKFQLKQEQENRHNASMMYNTTKDKLKRMEEQHQLEVQEKQKLELNLRNLELEMRTQANSMKQLTEDRNEIQRLLDQERSARTLQENLLSSHLRKQQEIEEENKRNMSKNNEVLCQLTEATDKERELLQLTATLQEQLTSLRTEMEHLRANDSLKESHLTEENEALKEQLEDARRDLKLNSEALTQTVFNCNNQLTNLKTELAKMTTRLENERQTREALEVEVESTQSRLAGAVKETELCLAAHSATEKALLREKEEHQRSRDRLSGEASSQRESVSSLSQKLAKAEAHANSLENEVHRATLQLTEKGLLLEVLQRDKDQVATRVKELESALQAEKEMVSRAGARQEAIQERLAQAQSESMLLRQQLEEAQNKGVAKERAVTNAQERFSDILSKLRSDCEERVQLMEDRNKELASKAADLRDQVYKLEEEKNDRETNLRQLQQELADSLKKLSMSEASLEVNTRYRSDLEEEKVRLLKDIDRLKGKLEEGEDQYVQAERRINGLKSSLDEKEKELTNAAQRLQEALSASAASDTVIKQLEEAVQRLEIENARLEAAEKQQSNKIGALQKGAQEAAMLSDCSPEGRVRSHLEDMVTNLQSSKMTLEDQLNREVQKQSLLSHTAQDSQAMWEEELKSRSKLGLRLAELEREKGELNAQVEMEKKKAKKMAEQKAAVDTRLDQEMNRNTELQKEMYRLRTLLKTAKKKLRDQDTAEFGSPMSSLRMGQADGTFGQMKDKVHNLQVQLEREASHRSELEKLNGDLKDQLASFKSLGRSNDQLERSKRQLEEEVLDLRRRMEATQVEQSQVEQHRRDTEDRARQEMQQKLEQVNLFLQSQAASQEALDQIKAANEANLRSQLEQRIRELEGELNRARTSQQDSFNQRDSTRTELDRYRQLYAEELRLRKSLAAKLDRANSRLSEANSRLLTEHSRSLITSNITNGSLGGPSLDLSSLGLPANYGGTLGPLNRSLGLGLSLLNPVADGQNSRVEDYLAKLQSELDRNISKELSKATAELDVASARLSPVGSTSRGELDPVSRAQQQYLEVLKKNYSI